MKEFKWCMAVILCLLFLTGCGKREVPDGEDHTEIPGNDWRTNGFVVSGEVQEHQALWALGHIEWPHEGISYNPAIETAYGEQAESLGGQIYRLYRIVPQGEGREDRKNRYLLETYDTSVMQASVTEIDGEKLGIDSGFISSMGIIGQGNYVFRVLEYERKQEGSSEAHPYLVYSDLGENTKKVDLLSVYQEKGIADKVYDSECICDAAGNSYTRVWIGDYLPRDIYILDREGNLLMEHHGDASDEIMKPFKMREGELIFPIYNNNDRSTKFIWFDLEKKEERTIAVFETDVRKSIKQVYGIQENDIYYESPDGIVVWNIASGDRRLVYRFDENGVSVLHDTMLVLQEGRLPVLRMHATVNNEEEDWLVVLSDQKVEASDAARVVSLIKTSSRVQNCVTTASRRNPGLNYTYEYCAEAERDDLRTRVIAEMVAGGGPDILYVSLEDMKLLQSRGLIKDLRTVLPQETIDRILPSIMEMGTVDGAFVGLAPEMVFYTAVTLKSIWDRDTWKLEDILKLLDTGNYSGIFCQGTMTFAPRALLMQLTEAGLWESALIDWEKGESHFESELFLRILEASTTYGDNPVRMDTWLGTGGCLGMLTSADLETIEELYEQYGEDFYFVGELTSGNCGNFVSSNGVLVVNANVSDSKAASAYLECLLTDEIQYPFFPAAYDPVLKIFTEDVQISPDDNKILFWKDHRLTIREDGSTYLNVYKELLENSVPRPESYNDITDIVWEEAQSYIAGDKPAKDVANTIDKRIQVYLDERK